MSDIKQRNAIYDFTDSHSEYHLVVRNRSLTIPTLSHIRSVS
jgi:hypothetical protein